MSGNSLFSLLAWMKDSSRLLGWGMIVALERRKANLIVLQEYIRRFTENSYIPPVKGEVVIVADKRMELFLDYVMDVPVLSFENDNLNDSKAMLTMSIMGGSQMTLEKEIVGWKAYKLDEVDPLEGPKLYLDLLLNEVPGDVEKDGRVKLDLSKSDNFRLTFAETPSEQRAGGDFFKDMFNEWPDELRVYPLGKIERGTNDLMRPLSFELRTQTSKPAGAQAPTSSESGDGAVLALIRTQRRLGGDYPGSGYKYLIPDDAEKDYSATVLFEPKRLACAVMVYGIGEVIDSQDFEYIFVEDELIRVIGKSGAFIIPGGEFAGSLPGNEGPIDVKVEFDDMVFPVSVSKPNELITIEFIDERIVVRGKLVNEAMFYVQPGITRFFAKMKVALEFSSEYEIVSVGSSVSLQQKDMTIKHAFDFLSFGVAGDADSESDFWSELIRNAFVGLIFYVFKPLFEDALKEALKLEIRTDNWLADFIDETIKLNFGQAILGNEIYAPHDIGFFGRINPQQTTFQINPMRPIIKAGSPQPFATIPPGVPGVQWKVDNLIEGPGNPGTINASGVYTAPAASTIKGRFIRVRVTATAPDSGFYSSALVTVVVDELSIHPLIQICEVGATVELSAGVLGERQLQWSIKNAVPGESGELKPSANPERDQTYHHGPVDVSKTYVIDQVEVKNTRTGGTRSMYVLALQKKPMLDIEIDRIDVQTGEVQLTAIFDGLPEKEVNWTLPLAGPGSIDSNGLYRAGAPTTDRFVLIFAKLPFGSRTLEGHIILPLPLVEFPQWLEVMSQ